MQNITDKHKTLTLFMDIPRSILLNSNSFRKRFSKQQKLNSISETTQQIFCKRNSTEGEAKKHLNLFLPYSAIKHTKINIFNEL